MDILLGDLARLVNGQLHGDPRISIDGADTLRDARQGQVTLADSPKLAAQLAASPASAVLVPPEFQPQGIPYVSVANVHESFGKVVAWFRPPHEDRQVGVSPLAVISPTARLGAETVVYPLAVIGDNVEIGPRCVIHSGVRIMAGCRLGEGVALFPNVVLYENTVVGSRSLIHAGAVIGAYGFGYTTVDGRHQLSAQLGFVVIGDDVEIGAGTTIDRGTYGATVIEEGTKIDNLVMIAHNCRIGRHNMICSQVGVAGSTTTGDYVVMAGQVGVRDHVHIGNRAILGAKAGVINDVPEGTTYVGIPATPERQQALIQVSIARLPELRKQVKDLQRLVARLEQEGGPPTAPDPA